MTLSSPTFHIFRPTPFLVKKGQTDVEPCILQKIDL